LNLSLAGSVIVLAAVALLHPSPVSAQQTIQDALIMEAEGCNASGTCNNNQGPGSTTRGPSVDPCFTAQNAMRPCPQKQHAAIAWSSSTNVVGMSYREGSETQAKHDAVTNCVQNHGGGDCQTVGWVTGGCGAIAISPAKVYGWSGFAASRAVAWNAALSQCGKGGVRSCRVALATCTNDDPQWVNLRYLLPLPLPAGSATIVDPKIVGTWEFITNPGRWVWQIGARGSYSFHSEAADLAPTHAGLFTAANGHWTLQATSGYVDSDGGTYRMIGPDTVSISGKYGTGTWRRVN
jgi:hypothetical protein